MARPVFPVAGLLANENNVGFRWPLAENRLGRVLP